MVEISTLFQFTGTGSEQDWNWKLRQSNNVQYCMQAQPMRLQTQIKQRLCGRAYLKCHANIYLNF